MLQYMRRVPLAGRLRRNAVPVCRMNAAPLSGLGFFSIKDIVEGVRSIPDVFGPTKAFQEAQLIRDEYNALADYWRDTVFPTLTGRVKSAVALYLPITQSVIARGAREQDLTELKMKTAEWSAMALSEVSVPVDVPAAAPAFDLAGFPWYIWLIAGGLLLPLVLRRGGR